MQKRSSRSAQPLSPDKPGRPGAEDSRSLPFTCHGDQPSHLRMGRLLRLRRFTERCLRRSACTEDLHSPIKDEAVDVCQLGESFRVRRRRREEIGSIRNRRLWCSTRRSLPGPARVSRSAIVGATTGQYPQDDDHLVLVVEAEADPPVADAQAPLEGIELADVSGPRTGHKAVEAIKDAALNRRIEALRSRRAGGVI